MTAPFLVPSAPHSNSGVIHSAGMTPQQKEDYMITHAPGASAPNFASEVLLALDELQDKVAEVTHLANLVESPHRDAVIVISGGELCVRGYDGLSTAPAPIKDGETLLAGITQGTLSMPLAYWEFRYGETGVDAVEGLRDYWVAILSGKRDDATSLLAWGYMPATTEFEYLGVDPLGLLDAIYDRLEWDGVNFRDEARRKGFLDMLEKALTEVCRPLFTEDLSHNELRAFAGHIEIVSELEARGVTRLIDLLATESQLSGELQDARRELAIIDSL